MKDCIQDVCFEILREATATKIAKVPLSTDTTSRRVADLVDNMTNQLINQIKLARYFFLELDENRDIANIAILMVYVRYEFEGEFIIFASLSQRTTGTELSKTIITLQTMGYILSLFIRNNFKV